MMRQKSHFLHNQKWNMPFTLAGIALLIPFFYCLRYVLLSADDFSNSNSIVGVMTGENIGHIHATLRMIKVSYLFQQGTWFASLIHFFCMGYPGAGYLWLRIAVGAIDLLFFGSVFYLAKAFCRRYLVKDIYGLSFLIILWISLNSTIPAENLFWLNGQAVYTAPLACCFLALAWMIRFFDTRNILFLLLACISGFCSTGGVLIVAGFLNGAGIYLVLFELITHYRSKTFMKKSVIFPVVNFVGALVNALAPGNFVRQQSYVDETAPSLLVIIKNTIDITNHEFLHLFMHNYLLIALLVLTIVLLLVPFEREDSRFIIPPIILVFAGYALMLVVWFPVVYGYNLVLGANIEARVVFLCSWMFVVIAISVYSYSILYLRSRFATLSPKVCVTTCVILLICAIPANILWVSAIRPIHADGEYRFSKTGLHIFYSELFSGELSTYYTLARECYDTAKYSETMDPIYTTEIKPVKSLPRMHLSSDPTWWVNTSVAHFYGRNSFTYAPPWPPTYELEN